MSKTSQGAKVRTGRIDKAIQDDVAPFYPRASETSHCPSVVGSVHSWCVLTTASPKKVNTGHHKLEKQALSEGIDFRQQPPTEEPLNSSMSEAKRPASGLGIPLIANGTTQLKAAVGQATNR